jgi:hypothetical protein
MFTCMYTYVCMYVSIVRRTTASWWASTVDSSSSKGPARRAPRKRSGIGPPLFSVFADHGHGHGHGIFILTTHPEGIWTTNPNPRSPSIPAQTQQRVLVSKRWIYRDRQTVTVTMTVTVTVTTVTVTVTGKCMLVSCALVWFACYAWKQYEAYACMHLLTPKRRFASFQHSCFRLFPSVQINDLSVHISVWDIIFAGGRLHPHTHARGSQQAYVSKESDRQGSRWRQTCIYEHGMDVHYML